MAEGGPRRNKVYKSMNRPLTILGAERRLFFVALISGGAIFALMHSLLGGIVLFIVGVIRARMHYTTLIELPASERIMEVATGDKDFWIIDAIGNYCFLHPAKAGIQSDLDLITNKGSVYSFLLKDDESDEPDMKVVIEPSDTSSLAAAEGAAKWVPAAEVKVAEAKMTALREHDTDAVEAFRANYPTAILKFDYHFKNKDPFEVSSIYHDDRFTYIRSSAPEKFAVYEVKDGKPDLIDFELRNNTYVIPQVMEKGYLRIGKHKLTFERKDAR